MRTVQVKGHLYSLPKDRDYTVTVAENDMGISIITQYTFPPNSKHRVRVEQITSVLYGEEQKKVVKYNMPASYFQPSRKDLEAKPLLQNLPDQPSAIESCKEKQVEEDTSKFFTGQRVLIGGHSAYRGTVVGDARAILSREALKQFEHMFPAILVCMDQKSLNFADGGTSAFLYTGVGRSIIVGPGAIRPIEEQLGALPEAFEGMPDHIRVYVIKAFVEDHEQFKLGETGRLFCRTKETAVVTWDIHHNGTWNSSNATPNTSVVPYKHLAWGITSSPNDIEVPWPNHQRETLDYEVGDLVSVSGGRTIACLGNYGNKRNLPEGAIARIISQVNSVSVGKSKVRVRIIGGTDLDFLGIEVEVKPDLLKKFQRPQSLFERNDTVKITAGLSFRNINLEGKLAKVVLPTDQDGDVGLEFQEDLNAGSLDGVGKQGHCLYVKASALGASE